MTGSSLSNGGRSSQEQGLHARKKKGAMSNKRKIMRQDLSLSLFLGADQQSKEQAFILMEKRA
jgi:hypothetical protein